MKRFHRFLAMILAIVTVWTVIPLSVFADSWLGVEAETEKTEGASSTTVTLSVDPEALLTYLKNGDKAGILEGISVSGLRDALDKELLLEIFSEEEIKEVAGIVLDGVDIETVLSHVDMDALIASADMDALVELIKGLPDLENYVLDYDRLMAYLDEDDLLGAIEYVDVDALIHAHVDELADLTLELDAATLADLVDIAEVVELEGVDFFSVLNRDFIENTVGYDTLFHTYIDEAVMIDYLHHRFHDLKHELHYYIKQAELEKFLDVHGKEIVPYLDFGKLQSMVASKVKEYADVEIFLNKPVLYGLMRDTSYASVAPFVNEALAKKLVIDEGLIDPKDLASYIDMSQSAIDMDGLLGSSLITDAVVNALFDGGAIDLEGKVDAEKAKKIIIDGNLIAPEELALYVDFYQTEIDMEALMDDERVITDGIRKELLDGGAIDRVGNVDFDLAKQIILNKELLEPKALLPYFVLGSSAIDMAELIKSALITADIYRALEEGGAVALKDCVDFAAAKQIILDRDLIDLKALVDYVELGSCALDTAGMMANTALMTDAVYGRLISGGAVDVQRMLSSDAPLFSLDTLNEKGAINISEMITHENRLFDVWELEDAEIIDFETVLVGDPSKGLTGLNPDWLVKEFKVFDLREMLSATAEHDALFTVEELAAEGIVLLDDMAANYGYDNIVDVNSLKAQVLALPDKTALIDCILDPARVIRTVGVKTALDATGESYSTMIERYVSDKSGFFNALGVTALLSEISAAGELDEIFALRALAQAIGFGRLIKIVDVKTVLRELIDSGVLKELAKSVDPDALITALTYTLGVLERNIHGISLDGVTFTEKNGNLLFIDPSLLMDTILDELLPELDDLVNLGDDGVIFSTEISLTYASEKTENKQKTVTLTVQGVLESGVDRVRTAATRAKALLEKFLIQDFNDGILTVDLRLPATFATVLRVALEKLSTSGDPALEELKDEILDLYGANVNDVSAFLGGLTLEQVVALLSLIDSSKFSDAYAKVMTSGYVEILLAYVKDATGQDFTDLTPEDLLIKAGELPTLEELCEKLEARLGREIEQLDRLPDQDPVEILERLAARAGVAVDLKLLLKKAAQAEDPLAALYEEAVERISECGGAYELIQSRASRVLNRLLDSRVGEKLSVLHLNDLYDGNGVFKYAKSITVDPIDYVDRLVEKGFELLDLRTSLPLGTAERVADILLSYFKKDTDLTLGFDTTLRAEDIYRVEFYEKTDAGLSLIRTAFLPADTDLSAVQPYEADGQHVFLGWVDPATGEICDRMPERDVQLVATLDDNTYNVYFYSWDQGLLLGDVLILTEGETLNGYLSEMNGIVRDFLKQPIPDRNIKWKNYPDGTEFKAWDTPITGNIALTWSHFYDVQLINPADGTVKQTLTVPAGTVLAGTAYADVMSDTVRLALSHPTLSEANVRWLIYGTSQVYRMDAAVTEDLALAWDVSYQLKVMAPTGDTVLQTLTVPHGTSLADLLEEINGIARQSLGVSAELLPNANIEWYDWTDGTKTSFDGERMEALILADGAISWKHFFGVTVLHPDTGAEVGLLRVPGGDALKTYHAALNQAVKDALSATHPDLADGNIVWFDTDGNRVDFDNATVTAPLALTWKLGFTVDLVWENSSTPYYTLQLVEGECLWDYLARMNEALRNHLHSQALTDENIEWYNANDPLKTVLDETALKREVVSDLTLSSNCYFSVKVLDEKQGVMGGLSFRVPYGSALTEAQISLIKADVLKYVNETLGLDYIKAEDVTFKEGDTVFNSWNAILNRNITLTWVYAEYYQVDVYAPSELGGALLHTFNVLGGHKISDAEYGMLREKIRSTYYPAVPALPDADIILIRLEDGENFGAPVIDGDVSITWRLVEYYDVEILYKPDGSDAWVSTVFSAREGNIFYLSWEKYAEILALRDAVAGPAPEDYEYVWMVVDANGNVTEERFLEQTAIKQDLRLTWVLRYNAVRYSISIVDPADPETVLWSADGLKKQTHVVTYLSEQKYGESGQSVWEWLQAYVAADDPHLTDYVHEYRFSWRKHSSVGSDSEILLDQYRLGSDLVLTWNYAKRYDTASLGVVGAAPYTGNPEVDDYSIRHEESFWVIRFREQWFEGRPTEFLMASDFLVNAIAAGHGIRFDANASAQRIELSPALLAKLYAMAGTQGVELESLTLRYAPGEGMSTFDFGGTGTEFFTLDFYLNGSEKGRVLKLGDFSTAHDPENGVLADVTVTLPFAGLIANGNGVKTFVCFENAESERGYEKYELVSYDLEAKTVSFVAPHFSSVAISNQFRISTVMPHLIRSGIDAELLAKLPVNEDIAFYPIDLSGDEYYPEGYQLPIREIVGKDDHLTKIYIAATRVLGYDGEQVGILPVSGTYPMPAQPIELCFEIAPKIYYVYYYVDGALRQELTQMYTAYMIETPEEAAALKEKLLSLAPLGEGYTDADGWRWNGFDDRHLGTQDMFLSLVCVTSEDSVAEKTVDVIYYAEDGVTVLRRVTYKYFALVDPTALPSVEEILGPDTDASRTAYWVNLADGLRVPADYSADAWRSLIASGETISLRVAYLHRSFLISTDGNVKVLLGETAVSSARQGATLTVSLLKTVEGKVPSILVKTASGEVLVRGDSEGEISFVMPAEDVMVFVTYTVAGTEFIGPDGTPQIGTLGESKTLPPIAIGAGMSIDLSKVPKDLTLVGAEVSGDQLILTYQYAVAEGTNAKVLYDALLGAIQSVEYCDLYVINGRVFETAEGALSFIRETADFKDWSDTVDKNLHFGAFEQASEEFPWIVFWILLTILILAILIALIYVLYMKGAWKPNFFLRVITAIVSAFFALCMALAAAWLAVLRLFGVDEERLMRKYPMRKRRGKKSDGASGDADSDNAHGKDGNGAAQIAGKTPGVVEELEIDDETDGDSAKR